MRDGFLNPADVPAVRAIHRRLCKLQEKVMQEVIGYQHAADCFCGEGGFWPLRDASDYKNEELAIDFIEEAVNAAIIQASASGRKTVHF